MSTSSDDPIYDDGKILIDALGVTLRRYYLPSGRAKTIAWTDIQGVDVRPMGWMSGRGRLWGSGTLRQWMPLDGGRFGKDEMVVLNLAKRVNPAFTPDDPNAVASLIRERIDPA